MPPPCRVPFLKCVSHLTSSNLLSAVGDSVRPGDILLAMSQDEVTGGGGGFYFTGLIGFNFV